MTFCTQEIFILVIITKLCGISFGESCTFTAMGLERIPYIESSCNRVSIYGNKIGRIEADDFLGNSLVNNIGLLLNEIYFIDDTVFQNTPVLKSLSLSDNQITISPILFHLVHLEYLHINCNNGIFFLPIDFFCPTNFSLPFSALKHVGMYSYCGDGYLLNLPRFAPGIPLKRLDVTGNPFTTVPDLSGLPNLYILLLDVDNISCDWRMCWLLFEDFDPLQVVELDWSYTNQNDLDNLICQNTHPIQLSCYKSENNSVTLPYIFQ